MNEDELEACRRKLIEQHAIGPTGQYPQGKLNDQDEGELRVAVGVEGGKVVIHFGKRVAWVCLTPAEVRVFAALLLAKADQIS